jgi:hypothetical protein
MSDAIRVITTCTSRKRAMAGDPDRSALPGLAFSRQSLPAERLYTGEQHRRLMAGVHELEAVRPVEVWVISAKAGLISGKHQLAPYDESFTGMPPDTLRVVADRLQIPADFRQLVSRPAPLTLVLAGNDYFDAAALDSPVPWASPALLFASSSRVAQLAAHPNLRPVVVNQELAKRWSLPLTLLKGELVGRLLSALATGLVTHSDLFADETARDALLLMPSRKLIAC